MRGSLGKTTSLLAQARRRWEQMASEVAAPQPAGRLVPLAAFGSNPGQLRMHAYVPAELAPQPALVVALHGCGQNAAGYDVGAGWSTLADRFGFAVLLPEQTSVNNPKTCFNWFHPEDVARGTGEAASIREGVERMILDHGLDRSRVFVTGLSAGGAMAGAMLATYPEVFAGGAIIAGLPYGRAANVQEALGAMFQGGSETPRALGDRVRAASGHPGPWPRVSVWHGSADTTVVPSNAEETVKQWLDVHDLDHATAHRDTVDGYPRRVWRDAQGHPVVESFTITGMAHGTPLAPSAVEDPHGQAAPFLLDVGIASSLHIARFWGLVGWRSQVRSAPLAAHPPVPTEPPRLRARVIDQQDAQPDRRSFPPPSGGIDVNAVITKALRSAGLMKG